MILMDGIEVVHVVAFDKKNAIGFNNKLAWQLPDDLKRFKEITSNNIVLMGRKTFDSIGKALPHRENIVVSGNVQWEAENTLRFGRIDTALAYCISLAKHQNKRCVYIIGGAEIYSQTLPMTDTILATEIDLDIAEADAYYPAISESDFELTEEIPHIDSTNGTCCVFKTYKKRNP